MRILYGVVGEGMGHAIRSRVVLDELVQRHDVQVVVSGRAHDYLAKRANDHLQVKKIWGFTIVTEDNEVRNFRTLLANVKGALTGGWPQNIKTYFEIADQFRPDVVISDFESWSYLYGVNHGLPVISVDNIQIINRCQHDKDVIAGHEASFQIAKGIVKAKVPGAYQYLITTFFRPPIRKKRTSLHPPVLRPEILAASSEPGSHLLVYQTYTSNQQLPEILKQTGLECRVYGLRPLRRGDHGAQARRIPPPHPRIRVQSFPLLPGRKRGSPLQAGIRPRLRDPGHSGGRRKLGRSLGGDREPLYPHDFRDLHDLHHPPVRYTRVRLDDHLRLRGVAHELLEPFPQGIEIDRLPLRHHRPVLQHRDRKVPRLDLQLFRRTLGKID